MRGKFLPASLAKTPLYVYYNHSMKKFLITFFILLILAGVFFFLVWVQFSVPVGSYGVIASKTHGVDPQLVKSGEFRWVWYKLIPTNVKIAVFSPEPSAEPSPGRRDRALPYIKANCKSPRFYGILFWQPYRHGF